MALYPSVSSTVESAAGLARIQYAAVDANGFPQGISGSIGAGLDAGTGIYIAAKKAGGPVAQPRVVYATGDNGRFRQGYVFTPAEIGKLDLAFGVFNETAYAAFTGTKIDSSNGEWTIVGGETNQAPNTKQFMIIESIDAQDANAGTFGEARFINWIYPLVTVFPMLAAHDEATPAEWTFTGVPTVASRYPWGVAFSKAVNGFTQAARIEVTSVAPITQHTINTTGGVTVTLNNSPTTDQTGSGILMWNATTGAVIPITSVNIATRVVTFPAQPSGNVLQIWYESFDLLN